MTRIENAWYEKLSITLVVSVLASLLSTTASTAQQTDGDKTRAGLLTADSLAPAAEQTMKKPATPPAEKFELKYNLNESGTHFLKLPF